MLKGYLQDSLNARLMKVPVTGNGRRESFAHLPMPRMTNTFMLGVFTYMATDDQLRSLTFWNLGSLGTAAQTACPAFAGRRFLHSWPAPYMNSLLRTRHKSP